MEYFRSKNENLQKFALARNIPVVVGGQRVSLLTEWLKRFVPITVMIHVACWPILG